MTEDAFSPHLIEAKNKAEEILEENFIEEPAFDITELVKNYGLMVEERNFGLKYSHVAGFIKPEDYLIVVNQDDSKSRKNFTIAHEFGHFLLHKDSLEEDPDKYAVMYRIPLGNADKDRIEKEANCFAANLLVPQKLFEGMKDKKNKEIAKAFQVSEELIGYRWKNLESGGV
jgi:Zn-dependent peptidase ImmA (M78 family)